MRLREDIEKDQDERLAAWAARPQRSLGRLSDEPEHRYRTAFQRDRDRVLHSAGFRRLQYKTQVFVYHEGDHFRNRLTHTLEGAQIGRTVARALGCNEDLVEAVILAHDLGHTPFGHSGERALHGLLASHGGFEHNRQSLRIVDWLEQRSTHYRGLNLTYETRAGILKHGSDFPRYSHPVALPPLGPSPSAEAQIGNLADEIAYHNHDIDDGLRSGLLEPAALGDLRLWRRAIAAARGNHTERGPVIVALIDLLATDLIEASHERFVAAEPASSEAVRQLPTPLVAFSETIQSEKRELADFLMQNLYRHHQVVRMAAKAERILGDLWKAYQAEPKLLPPHVLDRRDDEPAERAIADYLAGMTDRFAMDEHRKLFDPHAHV